MSRPCYVIFDADKDRWAFARMKGWRALGNIDFDFDNVHEVNVLRDWSSETTVKRKLRERFSYAGCVVVLIGEYTRNLYKYVRWELDVALDLDLPIVAVNLNGKRSIDLDLCPPIIRDESVVHVPFRMDIIKYAVENFPIEYRRRSVADTGPRYYPPRIYKELGLD
jgi:hypothetical protein